MLQLRVPGRRTRLALLGVLILILPVCGCSTSDTIRRLPPPAGLPSLVDLEKHLDYKDPDDGRPDYIPRRSGQ
jgi:hypothetical protein